MNFTELLQQKNFYIGRVIEFMDDIADHENYAEAKMRAVIKAIEKHNTDTVDVWFEFASFDEHNKQFEVANFNNWNGGEPITAREAGYYKEEGSYCFYTGDNALVEDNFVVISDMGELALLKDEFAKSGEFSYLNWLEGIALKALKG